MKATLTFQLPEDEAQWKRMNQCDDLHSAIWKFREFLVKRADGEGEKAQTTMNVESTLKLLDIYLETEGVHLEWWN